MGGKDRERRLNGAGREKYISKKQAEALLKRELRKVMDKVKASRRLCVCVRVSLGFSGGL